MDTLLADSLPNRLEPDAEERPEFPVLRSFTRESDFISVSSIWWNRPPGTGDYDTKILILEAYRNTDEPDAIENSFFDENMYENSSLLAMANIIKDDDVKFPVTRIVCRTVHGKFQAVEIEDGGEDEPPQVPASLHHIPRASLLDLHKIGPSLSPAVDLVSWKDSLFAFKQVEDANYDGLIREVGALDKLSLSPTIIDLSAIVVRDGERLHGFLMPYSERGSLSQVFERIQSVREGDLTIPWPIKLSWAQQIASGVADLHARNTLSGDLNIDNILLNDQGNIHLIDFDPVGLSPAVTAPELLEQWEGTGEDSASIANTLESLLTAAADVWSLGLVLRALAHETRSIDWWHQSIPAWYQEIVASCLSISPDDRPSAAEVHQRLLNAGKKFETLI